MYKNWLFLIFISTCISTWMVIWLVSLLSLKPTILHGIVICLLMTIHSLILLSQLCQRLSFSNCFKPTKNNHMDYTSIYTDGSNVGSAYLIGNSVQLHTVLFSLRRYGSFIKHWRSIRNTLIGNLSFLLIH